MDGPYSRMALARVGTTLLGKWRLERLLGVGGMASVYAATHRNGKRGAVKLLHAELAADSDARARFLREGYVANKVDHPGAVSVLDDDETEDGSAFLVMELLDGESVDARAEARPDRKLPLPEVLSIADQLLETLAAAHEKGIVHRDLKPENLFITPGGRLKVLDFGIARLRELSAVANATRTGSIMGTPAFMPPEQALGNWHAVDQRTDLWAVGATMFSLLTGRFVHEAETANLLLLAAMTKPAPPIGTLMPALPRHLAAAIDRALAFELADRWPDAHAMQRALRDPASTDAVSIAPASTTPVTRPTFSAIVPEPHPAQLTTAPVSQPSTVPGIGSRGRATLLAAGAGAALIALAVGVLVMRGGTPAPAPLAVSAELAAQPAVAPADSTVGPEASASAEPAPVAAPASAAPSASAAPIAPRAAPRVPAKRPAAPTGTARDPLNRW